MMPRPNHILVTDCATDLGKQEGEPTMAIAFYLCAGRKQHQTRTLLSTGNLSPFPRARNLEFLSATSATDRRHAFIWTPEIITAITSTLNTTSLNTALDVWFRAMLPYSVLLKIVKWPLPTDLLFSPKLHVRALVWLFLFSYLTFK